MNKNLLMIFFGLSVLYFNSFGAKAYGSLIIKTENDEFIDGAEEEGIVKDNNETSEEDSSLKEKILNEDEKTDSDKTCILKLPEKDSKKSPPTTEIKLGNKNSSDKDAIYIYIAPSCLHCGKFLAEDVEKFIKEDNRKHAITIKFLPTSAKDLFIMKLIQNEVKDEGGFYMIFKNYIKRVMATINQIKPTKEQISLYKGSKSDPEMIKFQVEASDFGFEDSKIISAIPDMDGDYEIEIMNNYKESVQYIAEVIGEKELKLPLIVKNGKNYSKLDDVIKDKNHEDSIPVIDTPIKDLNDDSEEVEVALVN